MTVLVPIVRNRYLNDLCFFLIDQDDSRLSNAWGNLWGILSDDNTLMSIGKSFLAGDGVELFLKCASNFPENTALNKEMLGTLGRVATVKELRHNLLMSGKFIQTILNLADSSACSDNSYMSLGILVQIVKDGEETWSITYPTYNATCQKMDRILESWEISEDVKFNLFYNDFEPILPLLEFPQCHHFALWTLACCTRSVKSKYFFIKGGLITDSISLCSNLQKKVNPTELEIF